MAEVNQYVFWDYVDGADNNVIRDWLNGRGKPAKAGFTILLPKLVTSAPPWKLRDTLWKMPMAEFMHEEWDGFVAIRRTMDIGAFRLLGIMDKYDVYLVTHSIHQDPKYKSGVTPAVARTRYIQMKNDQKYRTPHDYK